MHQEKKDKAQAFILIRLSSGDTNLYKSPGFGSDNMNSQKAQPQVLRSVQGKGLGLTRAVKCSCLSWRVDVIMAFCSELIWKDYLIFFFTLMSLTATLYIPLWFWTQRCLNNCQIIIIIKYGLIWPWWPLQGCLKFGTGAKLILGEATKLQVGPGVPSEERFILYHGTGAKYLLGYPLSHPPSGLELLSSPSFGPVLKHVGMEKRKSLEAAHIPVRLTL